MPIVSWGGIEHCVRCDQTFLPTLNELICADCLKTFAHYCLEWDGMFINMYDPEIMCCLCFSDVVSWYVYRKDYYSRLPEL